MRNMIANEKANSAYFGLANTANGEKGSPMI